MKVSPSVAIIILNYNTYRDTIALVEALQRQTVVSALRIVVVDNCSPNGAFEQLQPLSERFDSVVAVIKTEANLGYARGNNFGLRYVEEQGVAEYVAILNNDVILPDDCFERLLYKYPRLDNACIIAPMQLTPTGEVSIFGNLGRLRDDIRLTSLLMRKLGQRKRGGDGGGGSRFEDSTAGERALRVEMISGSFMFARLDRFRDIGYFYPNTFLYVEERFVAHAARERGYSNYVLLDESYIHNHSVTISATFNGYKRHKMWYTGILEYTRKCRPNGHLKALILLPFMAVSLLEWWVISLVRRR
ncbi:MAG: glycosyltransferase family 2 protein [Rikenellaceae bacterium]